MHHKKIYLGWEKYPTQVSGKLVTSGLVNVQKTNIEHFLKFSRENLELDEKKLSTSVYSVWLETKEHLPLIKVIFWV